MHDTTYDTLLWLASGQCIRANIKPTHRLTNHLPVLTCFAVSCLAFFPSSRPIIKSRRVIASRKLESRRNLATFWATLIQAARRRFSTTRDQNPEPADENALRGRKVPSHCRRLEDALILDLAARPVARRFLVLLIFCP